MLLNGKTIIITGASSGIGASAARVPGRNHLVCKIRIGRKLAMLGGDIGFRTVVDHRLIC